MLNDLVEAFLPAFPSLNQEEQEVSVQIHRLLALGQPLARQDVANSLQMPLKTINAMLNRWWGIHYDQHNRIAAYWGLSIEPTQHRFEVEGRILYTWCAWDTLFLPEILQRSVRITSQCAFTSTNIHLELNPNGVLKVQPPRTMISFVSPEMTKVKQDIVNHFCHFVHFFESTDAGLAWTRKHPRTFLLSVDKAYTLGRKINAARYPDVLGNEDLQSLR